MLAGCGGDLGPSPPPPAPPDPPVRTPLTELGAAPSSSEVSPPAVPEVPPIATRASKPARPLKTDQAKKALEKVRPFCAPAVQLEGKIEHVGCACCAPFVQCPASPTAALVEQSQVFALRGTVEGTFSGSGDDELALTFEGCESAAENLGGTLLVAKKDSKKIDYRAGVNPDDCKKLHDPRRNLDRLLCQRSEGRQTVGHTYVFVYDFSKKDEDAFDQLFDAMDNSMSGCVGAPVGYPVIAPEVTSVTAKDENGDGRPDIEVKAMIRKGAVDGAYQSACKRWMAFADDEKPDGKKAPTKPAVALGAAKSLSLVYLAKPDGTFEPTAPTRKATEALYHELNAFESNPP